MRNPATQSTVRINNQKLIIEYIMKNGSASRAALAKALSISKPTISSNVEGLIDQAILKEVGEGSSSGGRKPTLVNFNYDHRIIIAVDLNRNEPLIALSNLSGEIKESVSLIVSVEDDKPVLIQKLTESINNLIRKGGYKLAALGAISIAIPGVINEDSGEIFANPQFNLWTNLNLKSILNDIYHVPVIMKNDISMAALGEKHYGIGKDYDDMIYISVGLGVGAGLIINGQLFEGKRKAAGEIGYSHLMGIQTKNNLEELVSTDTINSRLHCIKEEIPNSLRHAERLPIESVKKALQAKQPAVTGLIEEISALLGMAVANTALVLDLEMIIIGGVLSELGEPFMKMIEHKVAEIVPFETHVEQSRLMKMAGIYGLLVIAKKRIMEGLIA